MLLGLDLAAVRHVLVTRCIKAGGDSSPSQTLPPRHPSCGLVTKAIYARLFDKLIAVINEALSQFNASDQEDMDISSANFIGAHLDGRVVDGRTALWPARQLAASRRGRHPRHLWLRDL